MISNSDYVTIKFFRCTITILKSEVSWLVYYLAIKGIVYFYTSSNDYCILTMRELRIRYDGSDEYVSNIIGHNPLYGLIRDFTERKDIKDEY